MGPQQSPAGIINPQRKSNISPGKQLTPYIIPPSTGGRHKHSLLELNCQTTAAARSGEEHGLQPHRPPAPPEGAARLSFQVRRTETHHAPAPRDPGEAPRPGPASSVLLAKSLKPSGTCSGPFGCPAMVRQPQERGKSGRRWTWRDLLNRQPGFCQPCVSAQGHQELFHLLLTSILGGPRPRPNPLVPMVWPALPHACSRCDQAGWTHTPTHKSPHTHPSSHIRALTL